MPKVETDTNQVYRKKYFVSSENVVMHREIARDIRRPVYDKVVDASRVVFDATPVPLRPPPVPPKKANTEEDSQIQIEVVKNGNQIRGLNIKCPCGRHAELDVQYGPTNG